MILANPIGQGHQQRIGSLGSKLQASKGWTAAAHTCFLMAELSPQPHDAQVSTPAFVDFLLHWGLSCVGNCVSSGRESNGAAWG